MTTTAAATPTNSITTQLWYSQSSYSIVDNYFNGKRTRSHYELLSRLEFSSNLRFCSRIVLTGGGGGGVQSIKLSYISVEY